MTYPTTYAEAGALLTGRCEHRRKLGNNTYLERIAAGYAISIRLHQTHVVTFHPNGSITLNSGGWRTVTTKRRMNQAGARVFQDKFVWYVYCCEDAPKIEYHDGITRSTEGVWS